MDSVTLEGEIVTETGATEVAVKFTVAELGTLAGAVYVSGVRDALKSRIITQQRRM
jgi:hypothetical protein